MLRTLSLFLLAFLIACTFWLATISSQQNIKTFEEAISVTFFNIPEGLHAQSESPKIEIKIDSLKEKNPQINTENFQAFIDLSEAEAGSKIFSIDVRSQDPNIRIVSYSPSQTEVTLESIQQKYFPIEIEELGEVSVNYEVEDLSTTLRSALIKAGQTTLNNIVAIKARIEFQGEENSFSRLIKLQAFDANDNPLPYVDITPKSTEIKAQLTQVKEEKIVGVKLPIVGKLGVEDMFVSSISYSPQTTTIQAKKFILENIQHIQAEELDLSSITKSGAYSKEILPELNTEITGEETIKVIIELSPLTEE